MNNFLRKARKTIAGHEKEEKFIPIGIGQIEVRIQTVSDSE